MNKHVVAVIGGGPAGCAAGIAAARALCNSQARVLLLQAGPPGTAKACAGGLTRETVQELKGYGIDTDELKRIGDWPFRGIVAHHDSLRSSEHETGALSGWVVPRWALDQKLRDAAAQCCQVSYDSEVIDIKAGGSRWCICVRGPGGSRLIEADALVLANGSTSTLSKNYGVNGIPVRGFAAIQFSSDPAMESALHFDFVKALLPGYLWKFPMGAEGANFGACALAETAVGALREFRARMLTLSSIKKGYTRPVTAPAQLWSGNGTSWHDSRGLVSAGDAAGLIDPFSGEGISAALISGARAGRAVASYLDGNSKSLADYSNWVKSWFGGAYDRSGDRARFWKNLVESNPTA